MSLKKFSTIGYIVMGVMALFLLVATPIPLSGSPVVSCTESTVYFGPAVIASVWKVSGNCRRSVWSLDAPESEGANRIVRENVTAPMILFLVLVAACVVNTQIMELVEKLDRPLLALMTLYPWLGLIRAVLTLVSTRTAMRSEGRRDVAAV